MQQRAVAVVGPDLYFSGGGMHIHPFLVAVCHDRIIVAVLAGFCHDISVMVAGKHEVDAGLVEHRGEMLPYPVLSVPFVRACERGYYDDAIKWYRKYAKVASVSDYDKKSTEKDLKAYLEQDNYYLFGDKSEDKPSKSKTPDDELMNLAFNGENDRQQEVAFQVLLSRKEYKEDRKVIEGALKFYEERGRVKEATKYINQLKKLGYLSESEASYKKEKLKE